MCIAASVVFSIPTKTAFFGFLFREKVRLSQMFKLSLLLPTRFRQASVSKLLQSIVYHACEPQLLEMVLAIDEDDVKSHSISSVPPLQLVKIVGPPGRPMGLMLQQCYEASSGRFLMMLNDDVLCRTNQWDALIYRAFLKFPDDIGLVYGNDLDQGSHVPTFPILSRTACEAMGGICPSSYWNLHIESHIFDVFQQLQLFHHNRITYLPDLVFEHLHADLGKSVTDEVSKKHDPRADEWLFIALDDDRYRVAGELAKVINKTGNKAGS